MPAEGEAIANGDATRSTTGGESVGEAFNVGSGDGGGASVAQGGAEGDGDKRPDRGGDSGEAARTGREILSVEGANVATAARAGECDGSDGSV